LPVDTSEGTLKSLEHAEPMATCPECRKQFADDVADCPDHDVPLVPDSVFANADTDLDPGTKVGDYEIESKLGQGSFGRVYRAVHPIIGRKVAIKVLNRALSTDPHAVSRFIAEARTIVEIESPHIVDIYSFGALDDGRQYYVMELLDGRSLEGLLVDRGALGPTVALRILFGMAEALSEAHAAGVVHRDLKPENVFVVFDKSGQPVPKLLDFGVAKLLGKRNLTHHTSTGALIGTPTYMAPEQALGMEVDHRADVYAFGIVAFEMLTGFPPFEAGSLVELVRMHANDEPPVPSRVEPSLGDGFDAAILQMLEKDPDGRPASMEECVGLLQEAAVRSGVDPSLPALISLRPPMPGASSPGARTPSWRDATVPVEELDRSSAGDRRARGVAADTVGGTAGAATLADDSRRTRSRTATLALLGGAALAAGGVVLLLTRSPSYDGPPPSSSGASPTEPTGAFVAPTSVDESPAAPTVELHVETDVAEATLLVDGKSFGPAEGAHALPRSSRPVRVEVRAPGYESAVYEFVPAADGRWAPDLKRAPAAPSVTASPAPRAPGPKPAPKPAAAPKVHSDLDKPGWLEE
jgi:serine/threonine-protein kinase